MTLLMVHINHGIRLANSMESPGRAFVRDSSDCGMDMIIVMNCSFFIPGDRDRPECVTRPR